MKEKTQKIGTVMIVDDSDTDCFIASRSIECANFANRIVVKNKAQDAIDYLTINSNNEDLPEIIFLDINMPGMDGFAFLQAFDRCPEKIKQKCKIIGLSTSIHPEEINSMMKNQFVIKYISKPLRSEDLLSIHQHIAIARSVG